MKTSGKTFHFLLNIFVLILAGVFIINPSSFAAQIMRGTGRTRTVEPAATKVSPERAKTAHKATPKSLLVIKRIYTTPKTLYSGDKGELRASVTNNNPQAVQPWVEFYLGRKPIGAESYYMKAHSSWNFGVPLKGLAPGTYTVKVIIDPDGKLEKKFYKGNVKVISIKVESPRVHTDPPVARTRKRTPNKVRLHPQKRQNHIYNSPSRQTAERATRPGNARLKTSRGALGHTIKPIPAGEITNVTVKIKTQAVLKARQRQKTHIFDIRWTRKGILPSRVDIFLYPYRQFHSGMYLKRNVSNNGHVFLPVPEKGNPQKEYIVRVQTHGGKIHGDSKSFHIIPSTVALTTQKVWKANTAAKTGRSAKLKTGHPVRQVKLDPGIGPNRMTRAARGNAVMGKKLPGKMTTYGPQPGSPPGGGTWKTITSPKRNEGWEKGKTYRISWKPANVKVTRVIWTNVTTHASHDIFSSTLSPILVGHLDWAVPKTLATGNYVITIMAEGTSVKSSKFFIILSSLTEASSQKPNPAPAGPGNGWKNHIPDNVRADAPRITYFNYTLVNPDKQKNYILQLRFYWEDTDLYGGKWMLEYYYGGKLGKKIGTLASLPHGNDFRGSKGMTMIEILFDKKSSMGKRLPIAFHLTDAKGVASNVVKKTVAFPGSLPVLPPQKLITPGPITFVSPSHSGFYVKGTKVNIQLSLNAKLKAQNPVIKIELVPVSKKGSHIVIHNKMLPKDGRVVWAIPESITKGDYRLRASSAKEYAISSFFEILDKGITVTTPKEKSHYHVGDTVLIQWKAKGLPGNDTMNIYFGGCNNKLNKTPVSIKSGSWSWKIRPGILLTGEHYLEFDHSQTNDFLARVSVTITYPKNVTPPSMVFTKPLAGQLTRWMAGTSQEIEWGVSGEFSKAIQLGIYLNLRDGNKPFKQCKIGDIKISAGTHKGLVHKTKVKIPVDLPSGPYQMTSEIVTGGASGRAGKVLGKGPVIEVLKSGYMDSMIPDGKTTFKIIGVEYPRIGGPMTVHVQVNSPKPFRITSMGNQNWGTQYLAFRISNYVLGQKQEVVVNDVISVKKNPSLFPNHVFPSGVSVYSLVFTPKLIKPVYILITLQDKVREGPFSPGSICWHNYLPKLEIYLDTFLQGNRRSSEYRKVYLDDDETKGINRKSHQFSGTTNFCTGALYVQW